ncbi:MAG: M48 family metalloprotease [Candidatus Tyrphobacter sp.]
MRLVRVLWLIVFLIPLGFFADRFCYVNLVDPMYHGLMWLHERLPQLFVVLGVVSVATAAFRYVRIQGQLRALVALCSDPPDAIREAFDTAASGRVAVDVVYIDAEPSFCFSIVGGRVVISRGFAELLRPKELRLVAEHEVLHIVHRDPLRALLWHLLFAAMIVPGFESLEEVLYNRRERAVDISSRNLDSAIYDSLLRRFNSTMCNDVPRSAFRTRGEPVNTASALHALAPTAIPITLLILLLASHVLFVQNLPYLRTHHC